MQADPASTQPQEPYDWPFPANPVAGKPAGFARMANAAFAGACRIDASTPDPEGGTILAPAGGREATGVLRHSGAGHCSMRTDDLDQDQNLKRD